MIEPSVNLALIGNQWAAASVPKEGVAGQFHLRKIPAGLEPKGFTAFALIFLEQKCAPIEAQRITAAIQLQLESRASAILVAAYYLQDGTVNWNAYGPSKRAIEVELGALADRYSLLLGVKDDPEWSAYRHMLGVMP